MYRTHTCGELRITDINKDVILAGWVQTIRKFGSITFIDLRDRYGITQLLFNEKLTKELDENPLGREFVIQVKGIVGERSNKKSKMNAERCRKPAGPSHISATRSIGCAPSP